MLTAHSNENSQSSLPIWLSIPIILLCLVGGGWIIHWYVMSDPLSHEPKILGDAPVQAQWNGWQGGQGGPGGQGRGRNNGNGGGGNPFGGNQRPVIRDHGDGRWELRTLEAHVDVSLSNGKLNWHTIEYLGNTAFVPAEVKNTLQITRVLVASEARVAAMKLTPDQVKKLRNLSLHITMILSESDRNQLGTAIEAYINAAPPERNAQEPKLLQLLDQIAQRSMPATKKLAEDRAAQINAIITPEMWQQDAAMGGAGNAPAAAPNKPVQTKNPLNAAPAPAK